MTGLPPNEIEEMLFEDYNTLKKEIQSKILGEKK
jgi:hypothetical protein